MEPTLPRDERTRLAVECSCSVMPQQPCRQRVSLAIVMLKIIEVRRRAREYIVNAWVLWLEVRRGGGGREGFCNA